MRPTAEIVALFLSLKETANEAIQDGATEFSPEGQWARNVLKAADQYEKATSSFINAVSQPLPKRIGRKPLGN